MPLPASALPGGENEDRAITEDVSAIRFRVPYPGEDTEFHIDSGLLILDGVYVAPPYHILTQPDGAVLVNGQPFSYTLAPNREPSRFPSGRRKRFGGEYDGRETAASFVEDILRSDGMLISQSGTSPYWLATPSEVSNFLNVSLNEGHDYKQFPSWLVATFPVLRDNVEFRRHARAYVNKSNQIETDNRSQADKVRLLDQVAYPLSSVGMFLVVLATGQLLSVRPPQRDELHLESSEASSNTVRFATMIVAFSILDLVWTILASHDGSMKELNPFGARLISDPVMLVSFKLATTFASVGILLYLRRFHRVTLASWWLCLVLTLLTARWLTFNSLLV
jgi:hypothetical protein